MGRESDGPRTVWAKAQGQEKTKRKQCAVARLQNTDVLMEKEESTEGE